MPAELEINSTLNGFRAAVEDKIRAGYYKQYGANQRLMEVNSHLYSDIKAKLMQKAKQKRGGGDQIKKTFSLKDLEHSLTIHGENAQTVLSRAYLSEAKKKGM